MTDPNQPIYNYYNPPYPPVPPASPNPSQAPTQPTVAPQPPIYLPEYAPLPPEDMLTYYQPIRTGKIPRKKKHGKPWWLLIVALIALYLFFPFNTDLLIMGVDRPPEGTWQGRTDTIILLRANPLSKIHMLSIPRDLWLGIPGAGENRINTAHFFAEINQAGSGPQALEDVVNMYFGYQADYYLRVKFDGFVKIVDAMGGINITLDEAYAGYEPGSYHLDGTQALAFARSRKGADDFYRMEQGQILVKAAARQLLNPITWARTPLIFGAVVSSVDTNIPITLWPRLLVTLMAHSGSVQNQTLTREMVVPTITDGGADVLLPDWNAILPVVRELFP